MPTLDDFLLGGVWNGSLALYLSGGILEAGEGVQPPADLASAATLATDYIARAAAASAALRASIEANDLTLAQLDQFTSEVRSLNDEEKRIRAVLDAFDADLNLLFPDGAALIAMWRAERALRRALLRTGRLLRDTLISAQEIARGEVLTVHVVVDGETLPRLAIRYYGDHRAWREIADANNLQPGPLTSGAELIIPIRE